ncbi:MAG: hypothetical protein ACK56F_16080, partial [bacterium]
YIQHNTKKRESRKRMTHSATSQANTPTHIHANSFKTSYKFIAIYRPQQKDIHQHELQQEKANDRKTTL